jgi:hypothetical protein
MQELLKTDYADIMYNEEKFYLLVIWKPKMNDENYKEVFNYCIEYAQSHTRTKINYT